MLWKKISIMAAVLVYLVGVGQAAPLAKVITDPFGNITAYWLEGSELRSAGPGLSEPGTFHNFSSTVEAFDLEQANNGSWLTYAAPEIYFSSSMNAGVGFRPPTLLSDTGSDPAIAVKDQLIAIAWVSADQLNLIRSDNGGQTFSPPAIIQVTGETPASPRLEISGINDISLCFLSQEQNTNLNKIRFVRSASAESIIIATSHDKITGLDLNRLNNPEHSLLIFWRTEYLTRTENHFSVSPDNGANFCAPVPITSDNLINDVQLIQNKLSAITYQDGFIIDEISSLPPATPAITAPTTGDSLRSPDLMIGYSVLGKEPLRCTISAGSFEATQTILPASQEALNYTPDVTLPDGEYTVTVAAFDGIKHSAASQPVSFSIDNSAPELISLEAARLENNMIYNGQVSEPSVDLTINGSSVSFESDTNFTAQQTLVAGDNLFTFVLSDEAGNQTIVSNEVYYNPASPEITVLSPTETDWFKPGSTMIIEARVFDLQKDLAEETEANISINGNRLEHSLIYDQADDGLFGFIPLPADLTDGIHDGTISLTDQAGNQGSVSFAIKIDSSPPLLAQAIGDRYFTNAPDTITLPLTDAGAGIDLTGTIVTIANTTFEGTASNEADLVTFCSTSLLLDGTYEVEIIPRDLIGNLGTTISFCLVVDTTPPQLTLTSTCEPQTSLTKMIVKGNIADEFPAAVKIYNNQKAAEDFSVAGNYFAKEIDLFSGNNDIMIEAFDEAGNKSSQSFSTFSQALASANLIQNCVNAPNPFSPAKALPAALAGSSANGKGMVFYYSLAQPADVKIRVYDLIGTLIWIKSVENTAAGVTAWSGEDGFGQVVGNGIYPYVFSVSVGGKTEYRKGKIIVYQ